MVAEFAGVAAAMQIFHVSKYISVPIAAVLVWVLVLRGTYRQVEVIFLAACVLYLSYVVSAIFAKPDWLEAARHTVIPTMHFNAGYLVMLTGLVGTTIAPWQFFYLQAGFVEKKVSARQYPQARADVLIGSVSCMVIVFFIIVCTAATLYAKGQTNITDAAEAAKALMPLAGKWAGMLFAFGLLNASLFAASILPLSTAHVICEGLGLRSGDRPQIQRGADFLLAVYDSDRGRCGDRAASERAAVENSDFLAGGQRRVAAGRGDLHLAAGESPRPDGRVRQHADVQRRGVGYGDRDDSVDVGAVVHGDLPGGLSTRRPNAEIDCC